MDNKDKYFLAEAIRLGQEGVNANTGGPFGAVIVKNGEIVGRGCNSVSSNNDPTAHAEIVAIRDACSKLSDFQLTDCVIYRCDYKSLTSLYDECPDLERFARKIAEYYFLEKEKKEIEIVLLDASQRYILFKKEYPTLEQLITQFHIASYLGVSATQLSRIRKQFASPKR